MSVQRNFLLFMGRSQPLKLITDFIVLSWDPDVALYTKQELFNLHCSFGYPSVNALNNLLRKARPEYYSTEVRKALDSIVKEYKTCVKHARRPRRFKLTIGHEGMLSNHTVALDIMYIIGKLVLHVVDEATHFSSATFLNNVNSTTVWKAFMRCWSNLYAGPPDILRVDQGSILVSKEFRGAATLSGIDKDDAPIESPSTMSHVERYHRPLRTVFEKLKADLPREENKHLLQMAVFCLNSTVGPDDLCPMLCIFGTTPRPARVAPSPNTLARAKAIDNAMKMVEKEHARRKVAFAKKYRGPYGNEQEEIDNLPFASSPVLIYRESSKTWEGPHPFVSKEGETVCVQLPHGRKIFRSHVVKPVTSIRREEILTTNPDSSEMPTKIYADNNEDGFVFATDAGLRSFVEARRKELKGLQDFNVFKVVHR